MPDITISLTTNQATRVVNAYRDLNDKNGNTPADNATQAQLLAHAQRVITMNMIETVKSMESQQHDPEWENLG